jgi:hypothetical protein
VTHAVGNTPLQSVVRGRFCAQIPVPVRMPSLDILAMCPAPRFSRSACLIADHSQRSPLQAALLLPWVPMHPYFQTSIPALTELPNRNMWWHSLPLPDGTRIDSVHADKDLQFKMWRA